MSLYLTTPLYYVNDVPHIGHAYCTIVADVLCRYRRLFGEPVYFLTGTDEHGQKVEQSAKKLGRTPQEHVALTRPRFEEVWKELEIEYDYFMCTSFDFHKIAVQKALQTLFEKGDIYSKAYKGLYCVGCEQFYTEKDLQDSKCPVGHAVQEIEEKNYFFRMSKYQEGLIHHIEANPLFIRPTNRKNEVLGFLRQPLEDLCISRPKSRLSWGIELPFDADYVTYVWFDALLNYITALGFNQDKTEAFERWWPHSTHLIGKDILTTHAVYWTTMLMALGVPLPQGLFAHGWWLSPSSEKMSKSLGNVVRPLDVKNIVGVEPLRYFLVRDVHLGNDSQFSMELVVSRINAELANNLGNLLSRTTNLITKYFGGLAPGATETHAETKALKTKALSTAEAVRKDILDFSPNSAIGHVVDLLTEANRYLENLAPWKTAKDDLALAGETLHTSLEVLRIAAGLLAPVMPQKMTELRRILGAPEVIKFSEFSQWSVLSKGRPVQKATPLFPRIEAPVI